MSSSPLPALRTGCPAGVLSVTTVNPAIFQIPVNLEVPIAQLVMLLSCMNVPRVFHRSGAKKYLFVVVSVMPRSNYNSGP